MSSFVNFIEEMEEIDQFFDIRKYILDRVNFAVAQLVRRQILLGKAILTLELENFRARLTTGGSTLSVTIWDESRLVAVFEFTPTELQVPSGQLCERWNAR